MTPEETNSVVLQELRAIRREVEAINRKLDGQARSSSASASAGGAIASDRDLDSAWGNPTVKHPPRWSGPDFDGYKMSETSPEFLDSYAGFKEWSADKDDAAGAKDNKGRPKGGYARRLASFARGWAARLRSGYVAPAPNGGSGGGGGYDPDAGEVSSMDDIPFVFIETRWDRP